jgi:tetratricopeptide (TPR) repeat protein
LSREHGLGRIEVANRSMAGFSRIFLNEARAAREDASAAAHAAALVGQPRAQMLCETLGVFASYEIGDMKSVLVHLDRELQIIRQLGARRFEAQNIEMRARVLLDSGRRREAAELLREALAICREVGTQFSAPKAVSALSRAVDDDGERRRLLAEGAAMLQCGAVGHNHLWFYRDAIEAMLAAGDPANALRYVCALEDYTRVEPLPWADLFAMRGRALAYAQQDPSGETARRELERARAALVEAGCNTYLPAVDSALAM